MEDLTKLKLTDLIALKDLQAFQDTFAYAVNVASVITDAQGNPITEPSNFCEVCRLVRETEKGRELCFLSDKILGEKSNTLRKPSFEACKSTGFCDAGAPIIVAGHHLANWMIGQVNVLNVTDESIMEYAERIGADKVKMVEALKTIHPIPIDKFEKILELLWKFSNYLSNLGFKNLLLADELKRRQTMEAENKVLIDSVEGKNKELEQVVYIASHDLRSPLVNIQGFAKELELSLSELLLELENENDIDKLKEKIRKSIKNDLTFSLNYIQNSTNRIDMYLSGILKISRLGRTKIVFQDINMNNLVNRISKQFESEIQSKKIKLVIDTLHNCYGDEVLIEQLFTYLLSNAFGFLDTKRQGEIRIYSEIKNNDLIFTVEDNGIGIAKDNYERIFDIFYKINPNSTGMGMGLTLSRKIMLLHQGNIGVESVKDRGSKFYLTFPKKKSN